LGDVDFDISMPVNDILSSAIDIYDISANTWSTVSLSETRMGFTVTTAGDKIYFAGGWNWNTNGLMISNKIDIYDNATGSLSVSALSTTKNYMASIFKNGKIYWAGGWLKGGWWSDGDSRTCQVEIKNINTQTSSFTNLFRPEAWGDGWNGAFEKENKIVFLGGYDDYTHNMPWRFNIYDITANSWSIGVVNEALPYYYGTVISADNAIYIAGGGLINGSNSGLYYSQVYKLEF